MKRTCIHTGRLPKPYTRIVGSIYWNVNVKNHGNVSWNDKNKQWFLILFCYFRLVFLVWLIVPKNKTLTFSYRVGIHLWVRNNYKCSLYILIRPPHPTPPPPWHTSPQMLFVTTPFAFCLRLHSEYRNWSLLGK